MTRFFVVCRRICGETAGSFSYSGYSVMPNSVMAGFDCTEVPKAPKVLHSASVSPNSIFKGNPKYS